MASRLVLQNNLEALLGSKNVYYQPPETLRMNYPAIKYELNNIVPIKANNATYLASNRYRITVIDRVPDNHVISELLKWDYCSYDRSYNSDNLNHTVLTLYY